MVAHGCNPSYLEGGDQGHKAKGSQDSISTEKNCTWAKSERRPYLQNNQSQKCWRRDLSGKACPASAKP
jgi:hypothetical protein